MKIKDNINCLFQHCIQALGEEHPIRVVNALQVPQLRDGKCSLLLLMRQYVCLWYQTSCVHTTLVVKRNDVYRAVATSG